jgi:hypothetical protein
MRRFALIAALALAAVPAALAQVAPATATQKPAPPSNAPTLMHQSMAGQYGSLKRILTRAAEAMPEEHYRFQPTPDMRPFVRNIAHAAGANYGYCANLRQTKPPIDTTTFEASITTKAQALKALADSFATCDPLLANLAAANLTETYTATRRFPDGTSLPVEVEKGGLIANYLAHQNEVYGYTAVYLRLKGIVPPTSTPPGAGRGRGGLR